MAQRLRECIHKCIKDESGQATMEYILILSVTVVLALGVMRSFIGPAFAKLTKALQNNVQAKFSAANLHYYPVHR